MRRLFVLGSAMIAAFVACTVSEENLPSNGEPDAAGPSDASVGRDVAFASDAIEEERDASCSDEGWCKTALPAQSLVIRDIWPFADRAFAVAESYSLGIRVMEWTAATSKWEYIDDNTPNDVSAEYTTKIWAPNPNEIYVAIAPFSIYRGVRGAEGWTWKIETVANAPAPPAGDYPKAESLGVWGTENEVYAWYLNTVYRRNPSGEWVAEYIAEDKDSPDEIMLFMGAAGIDTDNIWFSGVRFVTDGYKCTFLMRKVVGDYRRIADAIRNADYRTPCVPRPGFSLLDAKDVPVELQSRDGKHFFLASSNNNGVYRIEEDDGGIDASLVAVPRALIDTPQWSTLWAESNDRVWLGGGGRGGSSWGALLRGDGVWDGGKFEYSSTTTGGVPLHQRPTQIRGTSTANIWVVGEGYALHKTTP
ncbi:MAG: hypothetical protein K0S65_1197 [Labilithrix sp.]|nr:hypothetical protein [Labilithrix sp.]